jgi:hypothetical protein
MRPGNPGADSGADDYLTSHSDGRTLGENASRASPSDANNNESTFQTGNLSAISCGGFLGDNEIKLTPKNCCGC